MKTVFTSDEMKRCDTEAIEGYGLPGIALMENASMGAVDLIEQELGAVANKRLFILCGPGNNGGDGFAMARHLVNRNAIVEVFSLKPDEELTGDAAVNLKVLRKMEKEHPDDLIVHLLSDLEQLAMELETDPDLIIDAMIGTGLNSPLRGVIKHIVDYLPEVDIPVVAVDIPTGINAENGQVMGSAIYAEMTATMGGLKRGLLIGDARTHCGDVHVVDIGTPVEIFEHLDFQTFLMEPDDVSILLPWRSPVTHKYEAGSVFVLAGSTGLTGAAAMASESVLRAGTGIVKLGVPASLNPILEEKCTEVMTVPCPEGAPGTLGLDAYDIAIEYYGNADVGIIGPGIGRADDTLELARKLIADSPVPLVIDADALFALTDHLDVLKNAKHTHILTPHYGEFKRLTGLSTEELAENPVGHARAFAKEHKVILVLKGAPSLTAIPQGAVYINTTGNAGMATAGAGDVLTGIIGGFLTQFHDDWAAVIAGVSVHGSAGDFAASQKGEMGMLATDIIAALPDFLHSLGC